MFTTRQSMDTSTSRFDMKDIAFLQRVSSRR
jgi:hypothetical protein